MSIGSEQSAGFHRNTNEGEFKLVGKTFQRVFHKFEEMGQGSEWRDGFWRLMQPLIDDPDSGLHVHRSASGIPYYRSCERYSTTDDGKLFLWKNKPVKETMKIKNEYAWIAFGSGPYPKLLPMSFENSLKQLVVRMYWLGPETRDEFAGVVEVFNGIKAEIPEEPLEDESRKLLILINNQILSLIKSNSNSFTYFDYSAIWYSKKVKKLETKNLARISFNDAYIPDNFQDAAVNPAVVMGYKGKKRLVRMNPDEEEAREIDAFITRLSDRA